VKKQSFLELVNRYQQNQASPAERILMEEYLKSLETDNLLHLTAEEEVGLRGRMKANIDEALPTKMPERRWKLKIASYATAAVLLLVVGYGVFFLDGTKYIKTRTSKSDLITTGGNKAVLTLANGSRIELNEAGEGKLANQGNVLITKTKDGKLIYQIKGNTNAESAGENIISTPRGGQFQVILPDQTRVWLNAASSIAFPAAFKGNERNVKVTGEVYFEVAHDVRRPFLVRTRQDVTVEVLGTHFNVNAYDDEPVIAATLLSGSVLVKTTSASKTIVPGEQARVNTNQNSKINVSTVNTNNVVAWKDDLFIFEKEDIQTAMRRISRWYNVDIVYTKGIPQKTIGGTINRFKDVSELLDLIELTGGVKFKIEGRRILVMP
jgi:transmembrane sensor